MMSNGNVFEEFEANQKIYEQTKAWLNDEEGPFATNRWPVIEHRPGAKTCQCERYVLTSQSAHTRGKIDEMILTATEAEREALIRIPLAKCEGS